MNMKETAQALSFCLQQNCNVLLVGRPGVGKSAICQDVSAQTGWPLLTVTPAWSDPTDFKGLPAKINDQAEFLPFGPLRQILNSENPLIVFFDDLGQATAMVQAAIMQLIHGREIDGVRIPEHVRFIAATNDRRDKAGVQGILAPLATRFHLVIETSQTVTGWASWATQAGIDGRVIAFCRLRPEVIEDVKVTTTGQIEKFACPRTIHHLSDIMPMIDNASESVKMSLLVACLGSVHGPEFYQFLQIFQKITPLSDIIANPSTAKIPDSHEISLLWALVGMLRSALRNQKIDAQSCSTFIGRFPAEVRQLAFSDLAEEDNLVKQSPEYIKHVVTR